MMKTVVAMVMTANGRKTATKMSTSKLAGDADPTHSTILVVLKLIELTPN